MANSPRQNTSAFPLKIDIDKITEIQKAYIQKVYELMSQGMGSSHKIEDKRFNSEAWVKNPVATAIAAFYLLNADTLKNMAHSVEGDPKTKEELAFYTGQLIDAMSPANFLATNAEALNEAFKSNGKSLVQGLHNLFRDVQTGYVTQTNESAFEVGVDVANTEGAIVFENELFQLIEYKPLTKDVYETPLLFVPPCINKYYILDLQAKNSLIRYVVSQGYRTYVISWCNPNKNLEHLEWDDYVEKGVLEAIKHVKSIVGNKKINAVGFCIGGTLLTCALNTLATRRQKPITSVTLLTTLLDFTYKGVLGIFVSEALVRIREQQFSKGGLLCGRELATVFNFLRPNDLVWNYVQNNYLLGKEPPVFDLLYWNSDATNLPGRMYTWYLRHTYLENHLVQAGKCSVLGKPVNLQKINLPTYFYASRDDHIVLPQGVYRSAKYIDEAIHTHKAPLRFVLGASGHIAGVINPPTSKKRHYWTNTSNTLPKTLEAWLTDATEHPGSWWPDWITWLQTYSGKKIKAPQQYGNIHYPVIEPAPGRYVKTRIVDMQKHSIDII
jgi:polyhydroxyalkanoate synthase